MNTVITGKNLESDCKSYAYREYLRVERETDAVAEKIFSLGGIKFASAELVAKFVELNNDLDSRRFAYEALSGKRI